MRVTYILGLGDSGLSVLQHCQRLQLHAEIFDTRLQPPGLTQLKQQYPHIKVHLGPLNAEVLAIAAQIIISPGLDPNDPVLLAAKTAGVPIIGDIELFVRAAQAPIIGITGTNAKGTVTTLIANMLQAAGKRVAVGGNIGTPALDLLAAEIPDYYVLELSSFQLTTTQSLRAQAAVILNISEDHLDRHGSMEQYLAAKHVIYQQASHCIINRDQPLTWPNNTEACYSFGRSEPDHEQQCGLRQVEGELFLARGHTNILAVNALPIKGIHNALNALAALALGSALGLSLEPMTQALLAFKGLDHRCQWLREKNAIAWYNDSKGTNVGATLAALNGLGPSKTGKIVLIAGGIGKGQDFSPLIAAVKQYCRAVIVLGEAAAHLQALLANSAPIETVTCLAQAVTIAAHLAQAGDSVLLSPACASQDMFKNFEDRGQQFAALVQAQ